MKKVNKRLFAANVPACVARFCLLLFCTLACVAPASAQSVTISPSSGDLICALTRATETGYASGGSAIWRHHQLGLTMVCADRTTMSPEGILTDLGNNLFVDDGSKSTQTRYDGNPTLILVGGMIQQSYVQFYLPVGYRFTSYEIVVRNDVPTDYDGSEGWCSHDKPYYFGETEEDFSFNAKKYPMQYLGYGDATDTTTYTIQRTSTGSSDMGRVLNFKLATDQFDEASGIYMAIHILKIRLTFTTETENVNAAPLAEFNQNITEGVSCATAPFYTGRTDLGEITTRPKTTTTSGRWEGSSDRMSFIMGNAKAIYGDMIIYEDDCVDKSLDVYERDTMTLAGHKTITTKAVGNQYMFHLACDTIDTLTYFYELPSAAHLHYDMDGDGEKEVAALQDLRYTMVGANVYTAGEYGNSRYNTIKTDGYRTSSISFHNYDEGDDNNYYEATRTRSSTYAGTYYMTVEDGKLSYSQTTPTQWFLTETGKAYTDVDGVRYYLADEGLTLMQNGSATTFRGVSGHYLTFITSSYHNLALTTKEADAIVVNYNDNGKISCVFADTTEYHTREYDSWSRQYYAGDYLGFEVFYDTCYLELTQRTTNVTTYDYSTGQYNMWGEYVYDKLSSSSSTAFLWNFVESYQTVTYYASATEGYTHDGTSIPSYVLRIYNRDASAYKDFDVESGQGIAQIEWNELNSLNNDALKFQVFRKDASDNATGFEALVYVEPIVQAMDPYIDKMDVVVRAVDAPETFRYATFIAEDFAVGGGSVTIPLPASMRTKELQLSFENLHTKSTDPTYWNGEHNGHGRTSFVMSDYYKLFGTEHETGYSANNNVYNDIKEAANHDYKDKVNVTVIGNIPYKFNNAKDISDISSELEGEERTVVQVFQEYPFTTDKYYASTGVYRGKTVNGKFEERTFKFDEENTFFRDTSYVFTCDETRYNIAPTGAIQHRFYAYYEMEVNLTDTAYTPTIEIDTIYDTSYSGDNGVNQTWYGVTFYSYEPEEDVAEGEEAAVGYVTSIDATKVLQQLILKSIAHRDSVVAKGEEAPPGLYSPKQILYLDFSKTKGVITDNQIKFSEMRDSCAVNCLVFFPPYNTRQAANFARQQDAGDFFFTACTNIYLTDREPFFNPYEIRTNAMNYIRYDRVLSSNTRSKLNRVQTLAVPFRMILRNNVFSSPTDVDFSGTRFSPFTMAPTTTVEHSVIATGHNYINDVTFTNVGRIAEEGEEEYVDTLYANRPYFVVIPDDYVFPNDSVVMIVVQKGAVIVPSRVPNNPNVNMPDYDDPNTYTWHRHHASLPFWTATATAASDVTSGSTFDVTFTAHGTYCGLQADSCFYFSNGRFYSSRNLTKNNKLANVRPFRGMIKYSKATSDANKVMPYFTYTLKNVVTSRTGATDVSDVMTADQTPDLTVYITKGQITIAANADVDVPVVSANGASIAYLRMSEGDVRTLDVAPGIYIVKDKKYLVP